MAKKKSLKMVWIFLVIALIVIAATVYFMFFRSGTQMPPNKEDGDTKNTNPNGTTYQPPFPLKKGSDDGDKKNMDGRVHRVQHWLNSFIKIPYGNLTLDGVWGKATEEAIKAKMGINVVNEYIYNNNVLMGTKPIK